MDIEVILPLVVLVAVYSVAGLADMHLQVGQTVYQNRAATLKRRATEAINSAS
jgi:hypothetical protein